MRISRISNNSNYSDMLDALELMGFELLEMNFYRRVETLTSGVQLIIYCQLRETDIQVDIYLDTETVESKTFDKAIDFIEYIESILKSYNSVGVQLVPLSSSITIEGEPIIAKTTTRDFAKMLQRVKSSNVWSYAFQPKTDMIGDMLMQFKGAHGGPGDIYIYYDIPSKLWRKLVSAPSKGAFFWKYIRNIFKYAKLTGDKRTKLKNGL